MFFIILKTLQDSQNNDIILIKQEQSMYNSTMKLLFKLFPLQFFYSAKNHVIGFPHCNIFSWSVDSFAHEEPGLPIAWGKNK